MRCIDKLWKITFFFLVLTMLYISFAGDLAEAVPDIRTSNIDAILLIDFSKSMNKSDPEALSIEAFKMFIDSCSTHGDRIGAVAYTHEIVKEIPLREIKSEYDKEVLKSSLANIPKGDYTDIGLGLKRAALLLENAVPSFSRSMIILLSDGRNDVKGSGRTDEQSMEDMAEAMRIAGENEYKIYTIGLNINNSVNVDELKQIAESSKGHSFITDTAEDLPKILNTIFKDYVAAYNNGPVITENIDEIKISTRRDKFLDLGGIFKDPDSDAMLFKIKSSNEGVADIEISKGMLHIEPKRKGTSQLILTAEDPRGAAASLSITLNIKPAWYKYLLYFLIILVPALVLGMYYFLQSRKPLQGELSIQIKDENTGHIRAPYYIKLECYRGKVSLYKLLQNGKDYADTDKIYLTPGKCGRLNIKNMSQCMMQREGKMLANKKPTEIRSNEKLMITLSKIGRSIIIEYMA